MNALENIFQALRLKQATDSIDAKPTTLNINEKLSPAPVVLREIPLSEVAMHDDYTDCWIVIYDRVYNVTKFLRMHPGGEDVIVDYAGRDATLAFRGTGHSNEAIQMMRDYLIGELPENERIFRGANCKVLLSNVPE